MKTYHKPVLMSEVLEYMALKPNGIYVDATFGGGGHTRALLQNEPSCSVISIDWDRTAIELNGPALEEQFKDRFKLIWGNFTDIERLLKKNGIGKVDGILADFGTSQFQIHERPGFSFSKDTVLDMRMAPGHQRVTAAEVINKADEAMLANIFFEFGEERRSKAIAAKIVEERKKGKITTTNQLVKIIGAIIKGRPGGVHPSTRVFQALRIYVNDELNNIKNFLYRASKVLATEGRLVCISFHSLEDRIVKNFFKEHNSHFNILTPKVVVAHEDEIKVNKSARSAKLRAAELIKKID